MSLVPTKEDHAFGDGYRQASESSGAVIEHLMSRLRSAEEELEALRKVGWCAQALISAEEIKHPTMSRAEAVRDADVRLRQQLGKWQMVFCCAKAQTAEPTPPVTE